MCCEWCARNREVKMPVYFCPMCSEYVVALNIFDFRSQGFWYVKHSYWAQGVRVSCAACSTVVIAHPHFTFLISFCARLDFKMSNNFSFFFFFFFSILLLLFSLLIEDLKCLNSQSLKIEGNSSYGTWHLLHNELRWEALLEYLFYPLSVLNREQFLIVLTVQQRRLIIFTAKSK